jgi:hypothetical protein
MTAPGTARRAADTQSPEVPVWRSPHCEGIMHQTGALDKSWPTTFYAIDHGPPAGSIASNNLAWLDEILTDSSQQETSMRSTTTTSPGLHKSPRR